MIDAAMNWQFAKRILSIEIYAQGSGIIRALQDQRFSKEICFLFI